MCHHHVGDVDLSQPPDRPGTIPVMNGPIPFFKTPSTNQGPQLAWWDAPDAADRLDMRDLFEHLLFVANSYADRNVNFDEDFETTYVTCSDCNALMTQQGYMNYLIGLTNSARFNQYGGIIHGNPIHVVNADTNNHRPLNDAYGNWKKARVPHPSDHPTYNALDSLTPHVAYYLHLCLPPIAMGGADPWNIPGSGTSARTLYIQLCWVVLEITCLCSLLENGKQSGNRRLSHGFKCHLGAIEFYLSYFFWRLFQYEFMQVIPRLRLNFIQWHQKYFWDIINCKGIFPTNRILLAEMICPNVNIPSQRLVENACYNMMQLYHNEIAFLRGFLLDDPGKTLIIFFG